MRRALVLALALAGCARPCARSSPSPTPATLVELGGRGTSCAAPAAVPVVQETATAWRDGLGIEYPKAWWERCP